MRLLLVLFRVHAWASHPDVKYGPLGGWRN